MAQNGVTAITQVRHGSCQCGGICYSVNGEALFTYACHCHTCQKRTGSAFSLALVISTDSLQLSGELVAWSRVSDTGNTNTRYSCAACGNIIYGIGESSSTLAKLQAGTLDDTSAMKPEVHIWTRDRQPWLGLPPDVRQYETQPEDLGELFQAAVDYRSRHQRG